MIQQFIIIYIFELLSVISGIFYISKNKEDVYSRYFVYFLIFTVFIVESIFSWFIIGINNLEALSFLRGSLITNNNWGYNIYDLISFSFFLTYFASQFDISKIKNITYGLIIVFIISAIINLLLTDVFFNSVSSYCYIVGSLLLFLIVGYYFFQLFNSDRIFVFYEIMPFYVAIGSLIFYLGITPIFIYEKYYQDSIYSPVFNKIHKILLILVNVFMYSTYTIGFIICSKKKKSY